MLVLMKLPTAWGIRNASAFNLKAEALLKMSGLSYDVVEAMPQKGPKGKMPVLVDGEKVIGDSSLIQRHLETVHGVAFDEGLTPRDQADAMAYRKMAEEWLYFINLYVRWIVKPEITRDAFFGAIPWPMRGWIFAKLRRDVRRALRGQGLGRHSEKEIYAFGIEALDTLAARLADGPFFFGAQIRSIDAALYPQIVNVTDAPYDTPLREHAQKLTRLTTYVQRCDEAIFKDAPI